MSLVIGRLIISYNRQPFSMKKQIADTYMLGNEYKKQKIECFQAGRREHLIQHFRKCLIRQQSRQVLRILIFNYAVKYHENNNFIFL